MTRCFHCLVWLGLGDAHERGCPIPLPAERDAEREWNLGFRDGREGKGPNEHGSCYYQLGWARGSTMCYFCHANTQSDCKHHEACPAMLPAEKGAMGAWNLGLQHSRGRKKRDENDNPYYRLGWEVGRGAIQILADSEAPEVEEISEDCLDDHEKHLGGKHGRFNLYEIFRDGMKKKPDNDNNDDEE